MIYLTIPNGMKFEQIVEKIDGLNVSRDFFIDPSGTSPRIDLQKLVQNAIRENSGRKKCIQLKEFTIYMRQPPYKDELFLVYTPNRNGKLATETPISLVNGRTMPRKRPDTKYGSFWDREHQFTQEKRAEIEKKREEQRHDRRHDGDSPKAT